jgi:hypothetical protein
MLDLETTQDSRSLVAIKVMSVFLGVLVASLFLLPMGFAYNYHDSSYSLVWRWSYLTEEGSFYLEDYFNGNLGFAVLATIIEFIPDIVSLVLVIFAIVKMARLRKAGLSKSIWHSGVVLGAVFYSLAKAAYSCATISSNFISYAIADGIEYTIQSSLNILLYSQDEIILCILALYMAILAWKNYRYP